MPLEVIKKGPYKDTVVWGTDDIYTEGIILDEATEEALVIEETIEDNNGFTAALILLDNGTERKLTMVFDSEADPVAIGAEIEIEGVAGYIVTGRSKTAKRKAAKMQTITAKKFAAFTATTQGPA